MIHWVYLVYLLQFFSPFFLRLSSFFTNCFPLCVYYCLFSLIHFLYWFGSVTFSVLTLSIQGIFRVFLLQHQKTLFFLRFPLSFVRVTLCIKLFVSDFLAPWLESCLPYKYLFYFFCKTLVFSLLFYCLWLFRGFNIFLFYSLGNRKNSNSEKIDKLKLLVFNYYIWFQRPFVMKKYFDINFVNLYIVSFKTIEAISAI